MGGNQALCGAAQAPVRSAPHVALAGVRRTALPVRSPARSLEFSSNNLPRFSKPRVGSSWWLGTPERRLCGGGVRAYAATADPGARPCGGLRRSAGSKTSPIRAGRLWAPSFVRSRARWHSTVRGLIPRRRAEILLVSPRHTPSRTCRSRAERPPNSRAESW